MSSTAYFATLHYEVRFQLVRLAVLFYSATLDRPILSWNVGGTVEFAEGSIAHVSVKMFPATPTAALLNFAENVSPLPSVSGEP